MLVVAVDNWNNIATNYTGTIHLVTDDPGAHVSTNYTFVPSDAGVHTLQATFALGGYRNLGAQDVATPTIYGYHTPINIIAPTTTHFSINVSPNVVVAGQNSNIEVIALDNANHVVTSYTGSVGLRSSDLAASLPTPYTFVSGNHGDAVLSSAQFVTTGNQTLSANDLASPTIAGIVHNIIVNPNVAVRLQLSGYASPRLAGTQGNVTITALDFYNNIATSYTGTVHMSSSDGSATLPSNTSFTPTNAGVISLPVTLNTSGNQTLSANDVSQSSVAGTLSVVVNPNSFVLGGVVTGIIADHVTLTNTVAADTITVGNGNFIFDQNVAYNSNFVVAAVPPPGQSCLVAQGTGVMPLSSDYNVLVVCSPNYYILGGIVTGLMANTNISLQDINDTISAGNGNFAFPTTVAYHSNFSASLTQPVGQTCIFVGNSNTGVMPPSNDSNIMVSCSTNSYSLGGFIAGLLTNTNVILADGNDTVGRPNGAYTFSTLLPFGRAYTVTINNPTGQTCAFNPNTVGNGNMANAPVTNANVLCTTNTYPLGGTVTGLVSGNVSVTNTNNNDAISVANGNYLFDQNVVYASNYNVIVASPSGLTCTVANGNAVMGAGGVFNVNIACGPKLYTLGGNISGLVNNANLTLMDTNDTISAGNGNFAFPTGVAYNSNFSATLSPPPGQLCAFVGNSNVGVMPAQNDANIVIGCSPNSFLLGGTVTGLLTNTNITLQNGASTIVSANSNFFFPTPVVYNSNFAVSLVNPNGQTCVFIGNSNVGTMPPNNDSNVLVTCSTNTYSLGGFIAGLLTNTNVTLADGNDTVGRPNGAYTFPTLLPFGRAYTVTINNPTGQTCAFNPNTVGNGNMANAPVTNANVLCTTNTYVLGGAVIGLLANTNVTLQNGADSIATSNGNFVFPTHISYSSNFSASLGSPTGQTCLFVNNSNVGTMPASNDMNVQVTCSANTYSLGGSISGLLSNTNVTLSDSNDVVSRANGPYTFPTLLPFGRAYSIGIANPSGQTCAFNPNSAGAGTMGTAPVTNANVVCSVNTYPLGGYVTGLISGNVTLTNTVNTDAISVGNGNYLFDQNVAYAGNYNVVAASPNGLACAVPQGSATMVVGGNFNVAVICTPTPSTRLVLSGYATPRTAGQNSNINITAYDASNNVAIGYTGTVHLATSDLNAIFSPNFTFVAGYAGSANVPVTMTTAGTQNIRGNDIANPNVTGVQNAVVVNPNVATHYQLSGYPNPTTDCTAANVTVAAYDIYNNLATGYTGTVHLHSTDGNAVLGGNFTFAAGNSGSTSLPVTLKSTGTWAISANDISTPVIAGAQSGIVVNAGVASSFSLSGFPSPVVAGTQGNVTLAAYDACGNIATGYQGRVHLTSTDSSAMLAPDFNFTLANNGVVIASVTLKTAGTQVINVNDTAAPSVAGNQNSITVTAGSPNRLVVLGPSTATAGTAISPNILVLDAYGNVAVSYTGTVRITSNDPNPNATMPANHMFTGTDAGRYVYSNGATLLTAGTTTLTASDTSATVASGQGNVTVIATTVASLAMSASPNSVVAGTAVTLVVQAVDAYGNPNATYTGTVYLSSTDAAASFVQNPVNFTTSNNGSVTLPANIVMRTSGVRMLFGRDSSNASLTASANVTVSPNVVSQAIFGPPTIVNSTATFSTTLSAADAYGNINPSYVGTMTITSTDPSGTPFSTTPNSVVFTSANAGTKTLSTCSLPTVGYQTVTAIDSNLNIKGAHNITSNAKLAFSASSQNANIIFGASTFTSGSTAVNSNTFHGQGSAYITPKGAMYMPDSGHNRVLGFNALPTVNGSSADFVLGQTDFVSSGAACSQSGISGPWNASGDPNFGLLITDGSNNRVLIYKTFPTSTGATPDTAIGSTSFTTCSSACSASGLNGPVAVKFIPDFNVLLVSDYGNNRLLVFPALTEMLGVAATMVFGQPNLTTCTSGSVTASSMGPRDIWTNGTRLFVGDNLQHRILIFNSLRSRPAKWCMRSHRHPVSLPKN